LGDEQVDVEDHHGQKDDEIPVQKDSERFLQNIKWLPWRRGIVVIASAYRTEDAGFKSRQGVRSFGIYL
jgi:hypothetical protein